MAQGGRALAEIGAERLKVRMRAADNALKLPVTVVVPVRNEERNLARCLKRLAAFAHVLVVDSGSSDATVEIARAHGAELVNFTWNGHFPKKRNWVLITQTLSTEWVLFLDADENVTDAFCEELARVLENTRFSGFWLRYTTYFMGKRLRFGVAQRKLALFRVGSGLYERIDEDHWSTLDMEVHEHPVIKGSIGELHAKIEHNDYKSLQHYIDRHNQYSSWEARRIAALLERGTAGILTRRQRLKYRFLTKSWFPFAYFALQYFWKLGLLDGRVGLLYAHYKLTYFIDVRQKCLELARERGLR